MELESRKNDGFVGVGGGGGLMSKKVELVHPWPEWIELMERLFQQNYFDHKRKDEDLGFNVADVAEDEGFDFTRDWKTVQTALLNFGKDCFDILRSLSRQDLQILVGYGCPSTDKKVVFSSKLLRKHVQLDEGDPMQAQKWPWRMIWKTTVPTKVAFFGWLVTHEASLTLENLKRRGWKMCNRCYFCEKACESVNHIFVHCEFTWQVWAMFIANFGIHWTSPMTFKSVLECWEAACPNESLKKIWSAIPLSIAWTIWKERNKRCFEGKKEPLQSVKYSCLHNVYYWKDGNVVMNLDDMLDCLGF